MDVDSDDLLWNLNQDISNMFMDEYEINNRPDNRGCTDPSRSLSNNGFEEGIDVYAYPKKVPEPKIVSKLKEGPEEDSNSNLFMTTIVPGVSTVLGLKRENYKRFGIRVAKQRAWVMGDEKPNGYIIQASDVIQKIFICACGQGCYH